MLKREAQKDLVTVDGQALGMRRNEAPMFMAQKQESLKCNTL